MSLHPSEAVTFLLGEATSLPHTASLTHQLTLTLTEVDAAAGTAVLALSNPGAAPDRMVEGLYEEHLDDVDRENRVLDKLHLPERPVPVDLSTEAAGELRVKLHEKLQLGDRVWKVSALTSDSVSLTPGHDYESHSAVNDAVLEGYSPEFVAIAEKLGTIDETL